MDCPPPPEYFRLRAAVIRAFTLIELLAVCAVMSLLLALLIPAIGSLMDSYQITVTTADLNSLTQTARQMAITSAQAVEVRLYKVADSGGVDRYRAYRILTRSKTGMINQGVIRQMPDGLAILESSASSILEDENLQGNESGLSGYPNNTPYVRLRFLPNGSIDLPGTVPTVNAWTLTIATTKRANAGDALPANFATLSFDPLLGTTSVWRP